MEQADFERLLKKANYKAKVSLQFASECQMNADEVAGAYIAQQRVFSAISILQSHCNFNLSWLYSVAPEVLIHVQSLELLADNKTAFKRKLTIPEIVRFDGLIASNNIQTFKELKSKLNS